MPLPFLQKGCTGDRTVAGDARAGIRTPCPREKTFYGSSISWDHGGEAPHPAQNRQADSSHQGRTLRPSNAGMSTFDGLNTSYGVRRVPLRKPGACPGTCHNHTSLACLMYRRHDSGLARKNRGSLIVARRTQRRSGAHPRNAVRGWKWMVSIEGIASGVPSP